MGLIGYYRSFKSYRSYRLLANKTISSFLSNCVVAKMKAIKALVMCTAMFTSIYECAKFIER